MAHGRRKLWNEVTIPSSQPDGRIQRRKRKRGARDREEDDEGEEDKARTEEHRTQDVVIDLARRGFPKVSSMVPNTQEVVTKMRSKFVEAPAGQQAGAVVIECECCLRC